MVKSSEMTTVLPARSFTPGRTSASHSGGLESGRSSRTSASPPPARFPIRRAGQPREIVALNAGAALYVAGVAGDIAGGIALAREAIGSGAARARLEAFVAETRAAATT